MTGFEAIAHHNGWVMAAFGAIIVFSGLAVLSFVISQLSKLFSLFEGKPKASAVEIITEKSTPAEPPPKPAAEAPFDDPNTLVQTVGALAAELDQPFQLAELYRRCREKDVPHPHLSLSSLQRQGYLVFQGEGAFTWKSEHASTKEG